MNKKSLSGYVGFFLRILSIILAIPSACYAVFFLDTIPEYPWAIAFCAVGVLLEALLFFLHKRPFSDCVEVAGTAFLTLAACFFLLGGVLSIADYVAGVHIWGDASQFGAIVSLSVTAFCASMLGVSNCFLGE